MIDQTLIPNNSNNNNNYVGNVLMGITEDGALQ